MLVHWFLWCRHLLCLAISCLTTSNLHWFMDLTFDGPMQYFSLHHQTLLLPPDIATTEHCFWFGPAGSFFLELLIIGHCFSPVAYWTPSYLGGGGEGVIFRCHIFLPFSYWSRCSLAKNTGMGSIPTSSGPHFSRTLHMTLSLLGTLQGMAHSLIGLYKPLCHEKALIHESVGETTTVFQNFETSESRESQLKSA